MVINNMFTPFEQFEVAILKPVVLANIDITITNLIFIIMFVPLLFIAITRIIAKSISILPSNWQNILELSYLFILGLVIEQSSKKGGRYFPHLYTVFCLILLYNLVGLMPFAFTATSHIIVTLCLALSFFIAWIIIACKDLKFEFLNVFVPKNMPMWLLPLLVVIETLSFLLRPFSLGIRLFANMLAGHILLHILAGSLIYMLNISVFLLIPIFTILIAVGFLELFIAFLQAYIFTILLAIYLKDSLVSH